MTNTDRRQRAIARTREDILDAAARAFCRAGYSSATMRDIAREAGYTAASLYTYFKSKREILEGLVSLVTEEFLQSFDEPVPAGMSFPQRLELLLRRQLALAEERREIFSMFMALQPAAEWVPKGGGKKSWYWPMEVQVERLAAWFGDNALPAELGGHHPDDVARFLVSVVHGFLVHWVTHGAPGERFSARTGLMLDLFFHGVSGQIAALRAGAIEA
jgi:AcrR family transcriptional regulator